MLSNRQKALLKRAQRQAGLSDDEYREALALVTGFRTSTDPAITDRHLDKLIAYFEAIYWRGVDAGSLQPPGRTTAVFQRRGYWASKNTSQETSRDRFNGRNQAAEIGALEASMADLGFGAVYCAAIRRNVCQGRDDAHALHLYEAALQRTLIAKLKASQAAENPF